MLFPIHLIKYAAYLGLIVLGFVVLGGFLSPADDLTKADAIIAISGGETGVRTNYAIDLYEQGFAPKLIFSGDAFDPLSPSNADVMAQIATNRDVPIEDITILEEADNTEENAEESQDLIASLGYEKIILVTAEYHQRRASMEFNDKLKDVQVLNAPVKESQWNKSFWWVNPRGWFLTTSESVKIPTVFIRNAL